LDGQQHLYQREYDSIRDDYLNAAGFRVLRFWNHEVFETLEDVLKKIHENLISSHA
jgi:very-short-patch-repair endonuclease